MSLVGWAIVTAKCMDKRWETLDGVGSSYNTSTMHSFGFSLKKRIFSLNYEADDSKRKLK